MSIETETPKFETGHDDVERFWLPEIKGRRYKVDGLIEADGCEWWIIYVGRTREGMDGSTERSVYAKRIPPEPLNQDLEDRFNGELLRY